MRTKKGFSLVEMLIIVALLGILVMITTSVQDIGPRLNSVTSSFISSLNQAKTLAASENRLVAVQFIRDPRREKHRIEIRKQDLVSNLDTATWIKVDEFDPLGVADFFETGGVTNFVVNSLGEVRALPIFLGSQPTSVTQTFRIRYRGKLFISDVLVYPYGGYKIERREI